MPITTNQIDALDIDNSLGGASDGFALTKSDANYIEHPDVAGRAIVTKGVSLSAASAISVVMASGYTRVIPAGQLAAGVIHPLRIIRLNSTGTDGAVVVWGWI